MATARFIETIISDDRGVNLYNLYSVIKLDGFTSRPTFSIVSPVEGVSIADGYLLYVNSGVFSDLEILVDDRITTAIASTKVFGYSGSLKDKSENGTKVYQKNALGEFTKKTNMP